MQQISLNLVLGIVSGLIATVCVLFIRSYWDKIILPWYEEKIYQDAHIEGRWVGELVHSSGNPSPFIFIVRRKSHRVSGEMIGKDSGKVYSLSGEFRNMILTLTYVSTAPQAVDRGCFTFLLKKNGRELEGCGAFYYSPGHRIEKASLTLSRADAPIEQPEIKKSEVSGLIEGGG